MTTLTENLLEVSRAILAAKRAGRAYLASVREYAAAKAEALGLVTPVIFDLPDHARDLRAASDEAYVAFSERLQVLNGLGQSGHADALRAGVVERAFESITGGRS